MSESEIDLAQFEGHSPEPWAWGTVPCDTDPVVTLFAGAEVVLDLGEYPDMGYYGGRAGNGPSKPDERLIAAAPLLLKEVKRLRAIIESCQGRKEPCAHCGEWVCGCSVPT